MATPYFPDSSQAENDTQNQSQVSPYTQIQTYHVPIQYKIVDLPIIQMPIMTTLKTYPCKIYKKCSITNNNNNVNQSQSIQPAQPTLINYDYEWKRKCYGRIKFVSIQNKIIVAAYQYNSCHNRLKQCPIEHPIYYQLKQSQQFQYNWIYTNQINEEISVKLMSQNQWIEFKSQWQNAKNVNTVVNQGNQEQQNKKKQQQQDSDQNKDKKQSDSNSQLNKMFDNLFI